jgi:regulatory protein
MGGAGFFMDDLETIRKAALRFLNFKPRSEHELRQRLARKKLSTESVDHVVMWLQKGGMLDDEKFAKLYALSRVQSRGLGKAQIRRELTRRGISPARVSQAMRSIEDFDEFEVAKNLAARRLPSLKGLTADVKRRRLHGMLVRRGFQAQTIFKVLNALSISQSEAWDANE